MATSPSHHAQTATRGLNMQNPAVKRIMQEVRDLERNADADYVARPLEDNLFEWHFTIRGPSDSVFAQGLYHGRIVLPSDYPFKPPDILLSTPSGRFETNKKICLSISGYHPEFWQPSWSLRTVFIALRAFMETPGNGAIGSLDYPPEERKRLALLSKDWSCPTCGCKNSELLQASEEQAPESSEAPTSHPEPEPAPQQPQAQPVAPEQPSTPVPAATPRTVVAARSSSETHWQALTLALVFGILSILLKKAIWFGMS